MAAALVLSNLGCQNASTSTPPDPPKPIEANTVTKASDNETPNTVEVTSSGYDIDLSTPTAAYKTAHRLRKNKDVAGLKSIMSKDILEFLEMMGEEEKKSLDQMIKDMTEKPQADRAEARNERINGNFATVEYLTETGSWKTMDFEKIDGKWLLSFPKAGPDNGPEPEK